MKNMLLILLALIVMPVAVPVWAGDAVIAPSTPKSSAQATQTAPDTQTGVVIELKGSTLSTSALVANLEKQAVYKDAICSTAPAKKSGETAKITCIKADNALMTFLSKNAQAVQWSISGIPPTAAGESLAPLAACPTGCTQMACPPPSGPVRCCRPPAYTPC